MSEGDFLPPSFVARLEQLIESCDQPLIQLWSWPWSGHRRLLKALAGRMPDAWSWRSPGELLTSGTRSEARWWVADGNLAEDQLLKIADRLSPGQRLVLPVTQRLDGEILPQRILNPQVLRLRSEEIAELFPRAGEDAVEEITRRSDGWLGPLLWLREHGAPEDLEAAFECQDFWDRFEEQVIDQLDAAVVDVLRETSEMESLEVELWRRTWLDHPEKLAAFERLRVRWGYWIDEAGESPRLPRLMRQFLRANRPLANPQEIYRRLGLAAHQVGRVDEAERYFQQAGDSGRLKRLRRLQETPASSAPAVHRAPLTRTASPGFRLQLLGQGRVRRIDSDGHEHELVWRLRRAFQSLAFLALAPDRRATKEQLIDAIWRDASLNTIAKNFHPTMSEARRTLGHRRVFIYSHGAYTLNPELDWWIDCDRFLELIEQGRQLAAGSSDDHPRALEAWLEAWRLYRGELLSDIEATWIAGHRATFYREYIELLRGLGELGSQVGRPILALDAFRSLLLEEPFEERIHLAVMELYAQQGRRDLVRRQFVRMQELLIQELNVEPVEETRERYHQLMR